MAEGKTDQKIKDLLERVVADRGGAFVIALGYIGDRLGLFKAMAGAGELTGADLAGRTGLNERYVVEWLRAMVAAEYLECDPGAEKFHMTEAQATVLADPESRFYLGGTFTLPMATFRHIDRFLEVFREGGGLSYSELGEEISDSHDRSHKAPFDHLLVQEWLPKVPGLEARLQAGIKVLDVGCGLGRSSLAMARAYPKSRVHGLDFDQYSIDRAREMAAEAGVENVEYLHQVIADLPADSAYGFSMAYDCIHDMADPVGGLRAIRDGMAADGLFLWVELNASDNPLENRNPVGRMVGAISPLHCLTVSLAQGGVGLGNMIGEAGAGKLAQQAGFSHFEKLPIQNATQQFFGLRK